jgi:peptidyl-prolyl cis-trans isomerase C
MIKFIPTPLAACLSVITLFAATTAMAQSQAKPAMTPPTDDQVVAEVNGSKVLFRDVRLAYENLPKEYRGMPVNEIYLPLVKQLTERRLVLMAAEAAKLADQPDVASQITQARARILEQAYVSTKVNKAATEKALRARYEAESGKLASAADEVRASHILVETKEEADAIVAELQKGGDFAAIAKVKSKGPSGAKGGHLGYFAKDKMVPAFANAAFALKVGDVSAPVKTGFGWHIITAVDRRQGEGPTVAKRAPELRQAMAAQIVAELLADLSKGANIKFFNLDGSPVDMIMEQKKAK